MTSQTVPRIGWIGLGSMGLAMAKNLQKHLTATVSQPLHYTNRTISRGIPLFELGGVPCASVQEVVEKSDILFISVSDDDALGAILTSILSTGRLSGKVFVDTSTVHPDTSSKASLSLSKAEAYFVAAPVFGASPVAAAGQLLFVVAGPIPATSAIAPYLKGVMGRGVIALGEDVSQASLLKTSGNFITAAMMEMISEAHVFAEKTGLGTEVMEALFKENYGELAYTMSKRITSGAYCPARGTQPWSDLNLAIKDVSHGITCAEKAGTRLEIGEVALEHLTAAKKWAGVEGKGKGRALDSSSMYGVLRERAGLGFESPSVQQRDSRP